MFTLLSGLGLGLSLIVAIGAQNLYVLRQGIRREHIWAVVAVCTVSDATLILAGVTGLGLALQSVPWLIDVVRWLGAAFLACYGLLAARRAWRPSGAALDGADHDETETADRGPTGAKTTTAGVEEAQGTATAAGATATATVATRGATTVAATAGVTPARTRAIPVLLTVLALTWLNPHVYLDTVFLLGSVGATYGADRWLFALGAMIGSVVWFCGLGFGARYLGRWLRTPHAWRILDAGIALVMLALAAGLVLN